MKSLLNQAVVKIFTEKSVVFGMTHVKIVTMFTKISDHKKTNLPKDYSQLLIQLENFYKPKRH